MFAELVSQIGDRSEDAAVDYVTLDFGEPEFLKWNPKNRRWCAGASFWPQLFRCSHSRAAYGGGVPCREFWLQLGDLQQILIAWYNLQGLCRAQKLPDR